MLKLSQKLQTLFLQSFSCIQCFATTCSEENSSIPDVGVDMLLKDGKLDNLKNGPLYWVDTSDSQPCLGTASAAMWTLKCRGRLFHSGLPHKVYTYI